MAPAPKRPAQPAATRGSLSARNWQDIRQAARLARSEGVEITWRRDGSISISPGHHKDSFKAAGEPQPSNVKTKKTTHDSSKPQPMDTTDSAQATKLSKKQHRDTQRAKEHQALCASPSTARWKLLTQKLVWRAHRIILDSTFTAWRLSRTPEARLEVRRKLRSLLWREWTRARTDAPSSPTAPPGSRMVVIPTGMQVLGSRSLRDDYILARARAFISHTNAQGSSRALWSWLGFRRVIDFDRIHPGTRSRETAGLTTPASTRNRKKSRGGQKS